MEERNQPIVNRSARTHIFFGKVLKMFWTFNTIWSCFSQNAPPFLEKSYQIHVWSSLQLKKNIRYGPNSIHHWCLIHFVLPAHLFLQLGQPQKPIDKCKPEPTVPNLLHPLFSKRICWRHLCPHLQNTRTMCTMAICCICPNLFSNFLHWLVIAHAPFWVAILQITLIGSCGVKTPQVSKQMEVLCLNLQFFWERAKLGLTILMYSVPLGRSTWLANTTSLRSSPETSTSTYGGILSAEHLSSSTRLNKDILNMKYQLPKGHAGPMLGPIFHI